MIPHPDHREYSSNFTEQYLDVLFYKQQSEVKKKKTLLPIYISGQQLRIPVRSVPWLTVWILLPATYLASRQF